MKQLALLVALCAVFLTGCAGMSNPFVRMKPNYTDLPTDAMKEVATQIEQAVRDGNRTPEIPDRDGVVLNTELIMQCLRTRAARFERVDEFLSSGHAQESRNGLVYVCPSKEYKKATTRQQRDRDAMLVQNENDDRWTLFEGILKESNFPPKSLSAIQEIFHQARVATMSQGQKFEDEAGEVISKAQ